MAETVLETLVIKVDSDTKDADAGLTNLQKTLSKFKKASNIGSSGTKKLTSMFSGFTTKVRGATAEFRNAKEMLGSWFKESNDYVEALNLFNVAMGDCAKAAKKYANTVETVMGIDLKEWLTYQGAFYQLASGYGIVSKSSELMSKNLTQLAYDLSSLWNTDTKTAFQKLQSGMSGQIKGLKQWGINVSIAQLRQTALAHGIDLSTAKMTEAQKATLRYITIMEQTSNAQGDLARTIITPSNALRILNAQWTQSKRAMGQVVSMIAVKVIPWFQALVQIIKEGAQALAKTLGYELPEIDYSGINMDTSSFDDVSDSLGEAADNAKELKKSLLGIDELNIMTDNSSKSSASDVLGGGYASDFGLDLSKYNYDFLANVKMPDLEPYKQKLKEVFNLVKWIGAGFGLWKISTSLMNTIGTLKSLLAVPFYKVAIGATLTIVGFALEGEGIKSAIQNGLNGFNFAEILGGGLLATGSAALLGTQIVTWLGKVCSTKVAFTLAEMGRNLGLSTTGALGAALGAGIASIIAGLPMYFTGIYDACKNGLNWLNGALIPLGSTMTGAGIGTLIGAAGGPIGAGIGAMIGIAVGMITDFGIWLWQEFDKVEQWFKDLPLIGKFAFGAIAMTAMVITGPISGIYALVAGVIAAIKTEGFGLIAWAREHIVDPLKKAATWVKKTIVSPITESVKKVFNYAKEKYIEIKEGIIAAVIPIINKVKEIYNKMKEIFVSLKGAFFTYLWEPIVAPIKSFYTERIKPVVDKIKDVFVSIKDWFKTKLYDKIIELVGKIKTKFEDIGTGTIDFISNSLKSVLNGVFWTIEGLINGFIWGLNGAISLINKIPRVNIEPVEFLAIPRFADGGFPTTGQMFIAREAGPEMVGTIGNKSVVANNEQIIAGISEGVAEANGEQNALLREQNGLLRKLLEKDTIFNPVVGANDIIGGLQRKNRRDGKTVVSVGI